MEYSIVTNHKADNCTPAAFLKKVLACLHRGFCVKMSGGVKCAKDSGWGFFGEKERESVRVGVRCVCTSVCEKVCVVCVCGGMRLGMHR